MAARSPFSFPSCPRSCLGTHLSANRVERTERSDIACRRQPEGSAGGRWQMAFRRKPTGHRAFAAANGPPPASTWDALRRSRASQTYAIQAGAWDRGSGNARERVPPGCLVRPVSVGAPPRNPPRARSYRGCGAGRSSRASARRRGCVRSEFSGHRDSERTSTHPARPDRCGRSLGI